MRSSARVHVLAALLMATVLAAACGGVMKRDYEYEEELYLALDGSAALNINASVPAMVALHGLDWSVDPRARLDRAVVRRAFEAPGLEVTRVTVSRRHGRRFVHVGLTAADVSSLTRAAPLSWSTYRFDRAGVPFRFEQTIGKAAGKPVGDVGWTGGEVVAFRVHLPSEIPFHNSPGTIQRGNILEWEQPLTARLQSTPIDIQVNLAPTSILSETLLLFASTVLAAALVFALAIWWIARRGREADVMAPDT
jgi:hypothetical protein